MRSPTRAHHPLRAAPRSRDAPKEEPRRRRPTAPDALTRATSRRRVLKQAATCARDTPREVGASPTTSREPAAGFERVAIARVAACFNTRRQRRQSSRTIQDQHAAGERRSLPPKPFRARPQRPGGGTPARFRLRVRDSYSHAGARSGFADATCRRTQRRSGQMRTLPRRVCARASRSPMFSLALRGSFALRVRGAHVPRVVVPGATTKDPFRTRSTSTARRRLPQPRVTRRPSPDARAPPAATPRRRRGRSSRARRRSASGAQQHR